MKFLRTINEHNIAYSNSKLVVKVEDHPTENGAFASLTPIQEFNVNGQLKYQPLAINRNLSKEFTKAELDGLEASITFDPSASVYEKYVIMLFEGAKIMIDQDSHFGDINGSDFEVVDLPIQF